jgi:hypothetical protein
VIKRKTAKGRLKRALAALSESGRKIVLRPIKEQHHALTEKRRGTTETWRASRHILVAMLSGVLPATSDPFCCRRPPLKMPPPLTPAVL